MPIERDLSGLPGPRAVTETGWAPDPQPRFVHVLAQQWMTEDQTQGPRPRAVPDKRFRHSDAGNCARAVAYAALDLPPSNPMDIAGHWVTRLGSLIHDHLQSALKSRYGMEAEVVCTIDGFEGSGHADGEVRDRHSEHTPEGLVVVAEFKSVGGYAMKLAVGERGAPQGPSWSYVVQGALNAVARNADELVIGLLARDVTSVQAAERRRIPELTRFCAEWTLTREQFEPVALAEIQRVQGILGLLDRDMLPARKIPELPAGAVITDPHTGTWVTTSVDPETQVEYTSDAGTTWHCSYCRWTQLCTLTSAQRAPTVEAYDAATSLGLEVKVPEPRRREGTR